MYFSPLQALQPFVQNFIHTLSETRMWNAEDFVLIGESVSCAMCVRSAVRCCQKHSASDARNRYEGNARHENLRGWRNDCGIYMLKLLSHLLSSSQAKSSLTCKEWTNSCDPKTAELILSSESSHKPENAVLSSGV